MWIQKYAKTVVIKQTWAIILMTPHYLYWKPQVRLHLKCSKDYHTKELVLSQRVAKCSFQNSVKLSQCSPELDFSCFVTSWESGLNAFCEICTEKLGIICRKPVKTVKHVLLFV